MGGAERPERFPRNGQRDPRCLDVLAVRDFNLEIGRGDFVAIMGPSGCGKTTTLRMLAGLETPTSGHVLCHGQPIDEIPPWQREMPLVWQGYALFPFLSVLDNVAFGLESRKVPKVERRTRAQSWLERLSIGEMAHRMPDTLSGGQELKVQIRQRAIRDLNMGADTTVTLSFDPAETLLASAG